VENSEELKNLFIIVNAGFADDVLELTRAVGVTGATILNARGYGAFHKSFLGIVVEPEKEVILCITDKATADKAMDVVTEQAGVKTPAHGICFTIPIDKVAGINLALSYETDVETEGSAD